MTTQSDTKAFPQDESLYEDFCLEINEYHTNKEDERASHTLLKFMTDNNLLRGSSESSQDYYFKSFLNGIENEHFGLDWEKLYNFHNSFIPTSKEEKIQKPDSTATTTKKEPSSKLNVPKISSSNPYGSYDVEIKIQNSCKDLLKKYITKSDKLDVFFSDILDNFAKSYPDANKLNPNEFFEMIVVVEKNYGKERKLVPTDFTFVFVPHEIKFEFKSWFKFDKFSKTRVKVTWTNEDCSKRDENLWHRFSNMVAYYSGLGNYPITRESLEKGLEEIKEEMIESDKIISQMQPDLIPMAVTRIKEKQYPRGMLLYGPPGTGKTSFIVITCEKLKLVLLCDPLTAGDFDQGIVGDSAKMINHLADRAKAVPWEIFVLAIDEIESLVRDRSNEKSDGSKLSVLLGLISGVKDVPNIMIFCATNHIEMIDLAFGRRMTSKLFVGKPSYVGRQKWLELAKSKEGLIFDDKTKEAVVAMTMNFSHDSMKQLIKKLVHNYNYDFNIKDPKEPKIISLDYAKKFILKISEEGRIKFGKYMLPNLVDTKNDIGISTIDLKTSTVAFTGKIMIDLNSYLQMETVPFKKMSSAKLISAVNSFINKSGLMGYEDLNYLISVGVHSDYDLEDLSKMLKNRELNEYSIIDVQKTLKEELKDRYCGSTSSKNIDVRKSTKESILSSLIHFGKLNKFHVVYYVDSDALHAQRQFNSQEQQTYIQTLCEECANYDTSMIIFDVDSIAGISQAYSGLQSDSQDTFQKSQHSSFSYHISRQDVLTMILEKFYSVSSSDTKKTWITLMVRHPYLKKMIKDMGFPLTDEEEKKLKLENENPMKTCGRCYQGFNIHQNKGKKCYKHPYDIFWFPSNDPNETEVSMYNLNEVENEILANAIKTKPNPRFFRFNARRRCCGNGIDSQGCEKCDHDFEFVKEKHLETIKSTFKTTNHMNEEIVDMMERGSTEEEINEQIIGQSRSTEFDEIVEKYKGKFGEELNEDQQSFVLELLSEYHSAEDIFNILKENHAYILK